MKKIKSMVVLLISIIICVILFVGCGKDVAHNKSGGVISVALILDRATIEAEDYNKQLQQAAYDACAERASKLKCEVIRIPGTGVDRLAYIETQVKTGKYDLVIDSDMYYTRSLVELAARYPDTKFILVDENIAKVGKDSNLLLISYDQFEEGLLAGFAVAQKAERKVAVISISNIPDSVEFSRGVKAGVRASSRQINCEIRNVELPLYDVKQVLTSGQRLRNSVFASVRTALFEGADAIVVASMLPIAPAAAAMHDVSYPLMTSGIQLDNYHNYKNYLGCAVENYALGLKAALLDIADQGFKGGVRRMDCGNGGLKIVVNDDKITNACAQFESRIKNQPDSVKKMEEEK